MARQGPRLTLAQTQQVFTLLATLANFNWKGLKAVYNWLKSIPQRFVAFGSSVNLGAYWGRLLLIGAAAILIGFVLFDWRSQAVQKVEARAALAVAIAERDTLALKIAGDTAAASERERILNNLAELSREQLDVLHDSIAKNPDWANQPIPDDLRNSLRRADPASR